MYYTIVASIDKDIKRANKWNEHPQDCWDPSSLWWVSGALSNVLDLAAREHYSTALYYTSSKYKAFEPESCQPRYPLFNRVYTNKEIFEKTILSLIFKEKPVSKEIERLCKESKMVLEENELKLIIAICKYLRNYSVNKKDFGEILEEYKKDKFTVTVIKTSEADETP